MGRVIPSSLGINTLVQLPNERLTLRNVTELICLRFGVQRRLVLLSLEMCNDYSGYATESFNPGALACP